MPSEMSQDGEDVVQAAEECERRSKRIKDKLLVKDSSDAQHGMKLRVVLNFKKRKLEKKLAALAQSEYRNRLKADPQQWAEYKLRQKLYMQRHLNNLSETEKVARQQKKVQRQKERR
ncbi:hypothetical protein ElyMa_000150900 [Elysia marginata]|uniref:Ribosomal RNA-processing protein 36 n=1 Tax=Elysia marginata TaxID=1093978 RepID=A0AAV4ER12_9GAST|nr:hypothetical protein ElyMa_000150900 [Elysia marginata]